MYYNDVVGALCSFNKEIQFQNLHIYNIKYKLWNIHSFYNWMKKLFSEENKVPRTLFEARKVAGSATYKLYK